MQHDMGLPTHSVGIYQLIIPYNDSKDLSVFPLASTLRMRKKEPCHLPADHCATAPRKKTSLVHVKMLKGRALLATVLQHEGRAASSIIRNARNCILCILTALET